MNYEENEVLWIRPLVLNIHCPFIEGQVDKQKKVLPVNAVDKVRYSEKWGKSKKDSENTIFAMEECPLKNVSNCLKGEGKLTSPVSPTFRRRSRRKLVGTGDRRSYIMGKDTKLGEGET
jgi:hypothetical protein